MGVTCTSWGSQERRKLTSSCWLAQGVTLRPAEKGWLEGWVFCGAWGHRVGGGCGHFQLPLGCLGLVIYHLKFLISSWGQFSSVARLCPTLCNPMDCSTPGLPVHHKLPEFTQTHDHWVSDAIQPSYPLLSLLPTFNLSQHQRLLKWVSSSNQVAKVLEFQLQHQSFQWIFRTDFL